MGIVLLDMGMSLDGFAATRDSRALYPIDAIRHTPMLDNIIQRAGAVVMGRGAYDMGDPDGFVNYEYQVPIFVLTHSVPTKVANGENARLSFTFVTDGLESAFEQAKATAGDKNISVIGGIGIAQQSIKAGMIDEIQMRLIPTLLGEGIRLFEHLGIEETKLETMHVQEFAGITHVRYRIAK
jgi:dihydrofolate reductase